MFGATMPVTVECDPEQLHRMIRNLLHNAEEHAEHRITVTLTKANALVRLQIADDGPGVPAALRGIVFERFVRVDTARTRDTGGTGLGLAIVADVVASHHGSIAVTDSDPHGATFTVELPVHQPT